MKARRNTTLSLVFFATLLAFTVVAASSILAQDAEDKHDSLVEAKLSTLIQLVEQLTKRIERLESEIQSLKALLAQKAPQAMSEKKQKSKINLTGTWAVSIEDENDPISMNLSHNGDLVTGLLTGGMGANRENCPVRNGHFRDNKFTFSTYVQGNMLDFTFTVKNNNEMEGTMTTTESGFRDKLHSTTAIRVRTRYVNPNNIREYLELKSDGTFYIQDSSSDGSGKYKIEGDMLTLILEGGSTVTVKIQGNTIMIPNGDPWVEQ